MKAALAIGACLVLLILIVLALPFLVDLTAYVERYKPEIEEALQRKVELKNIRLTIWPRLGARVEGFTIMDDPDFGMRPFASFSTLDVGVKWKPLLSGRAEVEEIALRDPVITIIKNRDGVLNVSTMGAKSQPAPVEPDARPSSLPPEGGPLRVLALLAVDRLSLTGGHVTFRDHTTGATPTEYVVRDLDMFARDIHLGNTPTLLLSAQVPRLKFPVRIEGRAGPLKESGELDIIDATLETGNTQLAAKGSLAGGKAKLTLTSREIHTADLPLALSLDKPVVIQNLKTHAEIPYPLPVGVSPMDILTVQPIDLEIVMGGSTVEVRGSFVSRRAKIRVSSAVIHSGDLPVSLPFEKSVTIKDVNIHAETPFPFKAGTSILESLLVQPMEFAAVMGNSIITVKGTVVGGDIRVRAAAPVIHSGDVPMTIPALKTPIDIKNVQMEARVTDNHARLTEAMMQIFGGRVSAGGAVTLRLAPMPFEGKVSINGIQLGPLLEKVGTDHVTVSGTTTADFSLRGRGFTMPDLTDWLEGAGHVSIKDGKLEGINLTQEVLAVLKVVGVSPDAVKTTVFSVLETDVNVKHGVVTVQKLLVDSHDFQARAQGLVGLDQTLNLKAHLSLSQALSQKAVAASPAAKLGSSGGRLSVPLLIGGTVHTPTFALDAKALSGALQRKIQGKVQEKVQEEADRLFKGKSGEAMRKGADALKRLFGE